MMLTLQFHPDWPFDGGLVIEAMARDGIYRSQFETGTSNGGLTAYPGGERWHWESRLFEGRYDNQPASRRPVYGAWNRKADPYGGSPRFGSAYIRLRPELIEATTFCFPDSVFEPDTTGNATDLERLCRSADVSGHDYLDDYIEAHVHQRVEFAGNVEAVVLDPCFKETAVERTAAQLGCPLEWHPGFRVTTARLDPSYRSAEHVALARSLGEVLTPGMIGNAVRDGVAAPQDLKRVWHYLARFGRCEG